MGMTDILDAVRARNKLASSNTFEDIHLYFVLINDPDIYYQIKTMNCEQDERSIEIECAALKTLIIRRLEDHTEPRLTVLDKATLYGMVFQLAHIVKFIETVTDAFKDHNAPNLISLITGLADLRRVETLGNLGKLAGTHKRYHQSSDDIVPQLVVAGMYVSVYQPLLYSGVFPEILKNIYEVDKHLETGVISGGNVVSHDLTQFSVFLKAKELFNQGWQSCQDSLDSLSRFLRLDLTESSAAYHAIPKSIELEVYPSAGKILKAIQPQIPKLLLGSLYDHESPEEVNFFDLSQMIQQFLQKVSRHDRDIRQFLSDVIEMYPAVVGDMGPLFVVELIGKTTMNPQIDARKRTAVFAEIETLFSNVFTQFSGLSLCLEVFRDLQRNMTLSREQLISMERLLTGLYVPESVKKVIANNYATALLTFSSENLRNITKPEHEGTVRKLAQYANVDLIHKLVFRTHRLLSSGIKSDVVGLQPELLSDRRQLFSKRSSNWLLRMARTTQLGRHLWGDAPGDVFSYDVMFTSNVQTQQALLVQLQKNPNALEGFLESGSISNARATSFASWFQIAWQMEPIRSAKKTEFAQRLLNTPKGVINPDAVRKLWAGIGYIASYNAHVAEEIIEQFFKPAEDIDFLKAYCQGIKQISFKGEGAQSFTSVIAFEHGSDLESLLLARTKALIADRFSKLSFTARYELKSSSRDFIDLNRLADAVFRPSNPRFEELALYCLTNPAFENVANNPILKRFQSQLTEAFDPSKTLESTFDKRPWHLIFDNSKAFNLEITAGRTIKISVCGTERLLFDIKSLPPEVRAMVTDYEFQREQQRVYREQAECARRVDAFCQKMDLLDQKDLRELMEKAHVANVMVLMTAELFEKQLEEIAKKDHTILPSVEQFLDQQQKHSRLGIATHVRNVVTGIVNRLNHGKSKESSVVDRGIFGDFSGPPIPLVQTIQEVGSHYDIPIAGRS